MAVDRRLGELNIEYDSKRASGRLGPLSVAWLSRARPKPTRRRAFAPGSAKVSSSRRSLQYRKDLVLSFDEYVIS